MNSITDAGLLAVTSIVLFSIGHWVGGLVAVALVIGIVLLER